MSYHLNYALLVANAIKARLENKDNPEFYLDHANKTMQFMQSPYANLIGSARINSHTGEFNELTTDVKTHEVITYINNLLNYSLNTAGINSVCVNPLALDEFYQIIDIVPFLQVISETNISFSSQIYFVKDLEIFVNIKDSGEDKHLIAIHYGNQQRDIKKRIETFLAKYKVTSSSVPILAMSKNSHNEINLHEFTVSFKPIDIARHYGRSFIAFHEKVVDNLIHKQKGVVLLHGLPGTGKTNYIKYLASLVGNKKFIYIPASFITYLGSPDAIGFLADNENSVFIIEDCEQYIKSRDGGGDSAVAEILNLSDGILSDLAKCQIICTFNANIGEIDEALLREGRLIAEHYFDKVDIDGKKITLAELYNQDDQAIRNEEVKPKFGFV